MRVRIHVFTAVLYLALVIIASVLQRAPNLLWFGIRPNITLALLVALSFFIDDFYLFLGLSLIASALVNPASGFSLEEIVSVLVLIAAFFLRARLPFGPATSALLLAAGATFAFYLAVQISFITSDFIAVFFEMLYNALLAAFIYFLMHRIPRYGETTRASF